MFSETDKENFNPHKIQKSGKSCQERNSILSKQNSLCITSQIPKINHKKLRTQVIRIIRKAGKKYFPKPLKFKANFKIKHLSARDSNIPDSMYQKPLLDIITLLDSKMKYHDFQVFPESSIFMNPNKFHIEDGIPKSFDAISTRSEIRRETKELRNSLLDTIDDILLN